MGAKDQEDMNNDKADIVPPGAPAGKYHPGQIYRFFMGQPKALLIQKLGQPDHIFFDQENREVWRYYELTYDFDKPAAGLLDQNFMFDEDNRVDYDYVNWPHKRNA